MITYKRITISLHEDDFEFLQNLSDKTGLSKSTLFGLTLGGLQRDIKAAKYTEAIRLIEAWCSKSLHKLVLTKDVREE